ncbi:unnamed protein product [Calypogeia fissa]
MQAASLRSFFDNTPTCGFVYRSVFKLSPLAAAIEAKIIDVNNLSTLMHTELAIATYSTYKGILLICPQDEDTAPIIF